MGNGLWDPRFVESKGFVVCRVAMAEFEATLSSPARARRWLTDMLERWELSGLAESAILLTTEIVTNAVVHALSRPLVVAAAAHGEIEVGVTDHEPRLPRKPGGADPASTTTEGGRGLALVDMVADEWGATSLAEGKQVWFRLLTPGWSHQHDCRCHVPHDDRVQLASGRFVLHLGGPWDRRPQ